MIASRARLWTFAVLVLWLLIPVPAGGQTWQQLVPAGVSPTARGNHSAIYDTLTNRMTIFGGGTAASPLPDGFTLFGANGVGTPSWTGIVTPAPMPGARGSHSAVYDPSSQRMIMFGGDTSGTPNAEAWLLIGAFNPASASWQLLVPSTALPTARSGHTAVYDPTQDRMVVFGGFVGSSVTDELWRLDNANGVGSPVSEWRRIVPPDVSPPGRAGHSAIYDPSSGFMVIFGGSAPGAGGGLMNDAWVLMNAAQPGFEQWVHFSPFIEGTPPSPRTGHRAVYDAIGDRMLVFGGFAASGTTPSGTLLNDLWQLTNPFANPNGVQPTWSQLVPTGTPPASRIGHSAVFDLTSQRMTVFGGMDANGNPLGDTWVLAFEPRATLTVAISGSGGGSVTSNLPGIGCPGDCSEAILVRTSITLNAAPDANSTFTGWSGGGRTGTGSCQVTLTSDVTVTAQFTARAFSALTVVRTGSGNGTVQSAPAGIVCGMDCSESYENGTTVTLTATPDATSVFAGWSGGGCSGTNPSCAATIGGPLTVWAEFTARALPLLTVNKTGTGTGTVTGSGINCGVDCTEPHASGTVVTLTATSDTTSIFTGWSGGGCTGTSPSCAVAMTGNVTVTADFTARSGVTLIVARRGHGRGAVRSAPRGIDCGTDCIERYVTGATLTLTATPAPGHSFIGWSGGGCRGTGACTVSMTKSKLVTAHFAVLRLKVQKVGTGSGTVTSVPDGITCGTACKATYASGTTVTLTAEPAPGHTFVGWGNACTGTGTCTVTITGPNVRLVTAHFAVGALDVQKGGNHSNASRGGSARQNSR